MGNNLAYFDGTSVTKLPAINHKLTERQSLFVDAFTGIAGCVGDVEASAIHAGYYGSTHSTNGCSAKALGAQQLRRPNVQAAIHAANRRNINGGLATKAVEVLHDILHSTGTDINSNKLRLEAAKTVLDRAGYVAPKGGAEAPHNKRPEDMTIPELEDFIRRGNEAISLAAQPIIEGDFTPVGVEDGDDPDLTD
jgi:hypothetical protein